MKVTDKSQVILSEDDILNGLYSGKITALSELNVEDIALVEQFNQARKQNADPFPELKAFTETLESLQEFDVKNQTNWFMPEEYKNFDIENYLLCQSTDIVAYNRVEAELALFRQHNMIMVLKYLKYLVDTMRQNNVVWGVGRGSSVASYCLYLLGVHKVDSIKYELDIHEFLK